MTICSLANQHIGAYLMLGYWVGVGVLLWLLRVRFLEPRLSRKYPLAHRTAILGAASPPGPHQQPDAG